MLEITKVLNPSRPIYSVIGNICKNTNLLRDPELHLSEKDFLQEFHKVVFQSIQNLTYSGTGVNSINEVDIDNYLASYPQLYKIWEKSDGLTYVRDSIQHANDSTFKPNYERLKKFALLRHYVSNGIDVSDLYDYTSSDLKVQDEGMKKIDKMTAQEIIEHYALKMMKLRDEFNVGTESRDFVAGEDLDNLLSDLNKEPEFGYPFSNSYYNAIFRGQRPGKFMLRSAGTGTGKTRTALADMCNISVSEMYDLDLDVWKPNGPSYPSLYISTELEKREVQTIMLAIVSGVNEQVIKDGHYSEKLKMRLQKAIEVLKKAPIFCVYVDDFSVADIEMIIERYIIEKDVKFVAFDYIQMTPKLSRSMANAFGSNLREDQILVQFSAAIKILCNKYNVYTLSSTQLNRNAKDADLRDTNSLRGGSATADKVDHGVMTFKVTQKDLDNLKHILERGFFEKPNYSHWVYKNRSGRSNLIIWTVMDLGNMREKPLFVTDTDYNLQDDILKVEIDFASKKDDFVLNF